MAGESKKRLRAQERVNAVGVHQKGKNRLRVECSTDGLGHNWLKNFRLGEYAGHHSINLPCALFVSRWMTIHGHIQQIIPHEKHCDPFCAHAQSISIHVWVRHGRRQAEGIGVARLPTGFLQISSLVNQLYLDSRKAILFTSRPRSLVRRQALLYQGEGLERTERGRSEYQASKERSY